MSRVRIWELTCPGLLEEVGRARRWTRDILSDTPYADDVALIVTELGSNALRHSSSGSEHGAFHLVLAHSPRTVTISVTDSGGSRTAPHIEQPRDDDTHGRGLRLVTALAHRVHIHGDDRQGHTVTAEFHLGSTTARQLERSPLAADRHHVRAHLTERPQMSARPLVTPGYWCECTANGKPVGSFDAYSPHQALRWTRISLMMLTTELDETAYQQARAWTTNGQTQALQDLRNGHPQPLTITHQATALTWTTRPVLFLTLLHRQTTQLPACTQRFAAPEPARHPH